MRALVRNRSKASALETHPGVDFLEGDMLRPETLGAALEGVERVLMISSSEERMVETQCSFIDTCKQAGVRHIVKFSGKESGIGFDSSKFRFTRMHEEIERYLKTSGLLWTHLRPSQFMQVYFREVPTMVSDSAFFLPMGNAKLSPVDIEDIAKIAVAVLHGEGHESKSYEMTGPEALTMTEIAELISTAIGRTIRYVNVAPEDKRRALIGAGAPERADALDELFADVANARNQESTSRHMRHSEFRLQPLPNLPAGTPSAFLSFLCQPHSRHLPPNGFSR